VEASAHLGTRQLFVTQHRGLDHLGIGLGLLNTGGERMFQLLRQIGKYRSEASLRCLE